MAKRKKLTSSEFEKKKSIASPDKKTVRKPQIKLDDKKVEAISAKIAFMNKRFETLIKECKDALCKLNDTKHIEA